MDENSSEWKNNIEANEESKRLVEMFCRTLLKTVAGEEDEPDSGVRVSFQKNGYDEFLELFYRVISRIHYVLLTAVLCAFLMGIYTFLIAKPQYSATAKLYIMGQNSSSVLTDLQIGSYLTMDYQEVFKTWEVHEMVRKELNLPYSYREMQEMLTVSNPSDTRVLYITVKNSDPHEATDIANAYAESAKKFILETMDSEEPSIFSLALVPGSASGIGHISYIIIGFLLGSIFSVGAIVIKQLLDNHPKTPEDIAKYTGLPTLAIIPKKGAKGGAK